MKKERAGWFVVAGAVIGLSGLLPEAQGQSERYSSETIVLGTGGYQLNFAVLWTCDDNPQGTSSAPGEIDLVDSKNSVVGQIFATASHSTPSVTVSGAGSVTAVSLSVHIYGANGTPADANLHGSWVITGPSPGTYTLHFWYSQSELPLEPSSTITTETMDAGGGGTLGAVPTPTPTPAPIPTTPPSVTVGAPSAATALQPVSIEATATLGTGGASLASVAIDYSLDNGSTWSRVATDAQPSNPTAALSGTATFAASGTVILRATATDSDGLSGTAEQALTVGQAPQTAITLSPASASLTVGQTQGFTASGGATGNYSWGGAASGAGASASVVFASAGVFTVTVVDTGNATYSASAAASATVTVSPIFYVLTLTSTSGGSVSGGGTYTANATATAVASPAPGNYFEGWTGDLTSGAPTLSLTMSSNRSLVAHFSSLLTQTITVDTPQAITTRTAPFNLSAVASSGLPVTLTLNSGPVSLSGNQVTPLGSTGQVLLTASQPGNGQYLPAQSVTVTFTVGPPPVGAVLTDDSSATKRSDRTTRMTSYTSDPAH